jgi:hypothetical protein
MAKDNTQKVVLIATQLINFSDKLMLTVEEGNALLQLKESSGIDLTAFDEVYPLHASLAHVDGTALNNVLSTIGALNTWLTTTFNDDNLQTVRRGKEG